MRILIAIAFILFVTGCSSVNVVNNCPVWAEVATVDIVNDTEQTKRWIYRYEKNRIRECK